MRKIEINAVAAAASIIGFSALFMDWFKLKANRVVTGQGLGFFESLGTPLGLLIIAVWVSTLAVALMGPRRSKMFLPFLFVAALVEVLIGSGFASRNLLAGAGDLARVSLSGGFWISFLAVYLMYFVTTRKEQPFHSFIGVLGLAILIAALVFGWLNTFSVLVEFQSQKVRFVAELWRHLEIFGISLTLAVIIGLPLGIWLSKSHAARPVLGILGLVQTIPSLALFGILLVTIAAIKSSLHAFGISAIGIVPAIIAITLYSLLPIVQNTFTGIKAVTRDVCDAGEGLGMSRVQLLYKIELPLAAANVISGIKVAAVQAVGGTAVAALIGAGGLGFFVFQGLGQAAPDLILLGALSVVILALFVNGIFQVIESRMASQRMVSE